MCQKVGDGAEERKGLKNPTGLQVLWEVAPFGMRTGLEKAGKGVTSKPGQRPSSGQAFRTWDTQQLPPACPVAVLMSAALLGASPEPRASSSPAQPSARFLSGPRFLEPAGCCSLGCERYGPQGGRCSWGRASRGRRGPAKLTACVYPRVLCLARSTNSRLAIKDSTAEEK